MQENGQTLCMSDFSYLPISEMSGKNSIQYSCPKTGKSRLSGQLKNVDLAALACYYDGRSYCDSYTSCGSPILRREQGGEQLRSCNLNGHVKGKRNSSFIFIRL